MLNEELLFCNILFYKVLRPGVGGPALLQGKVVIMATVGC
jgi:hypothetical protein